MRIILLKDIKSLGKNGEIKEVKSGYARNFLFPNNFAELLTPDMVQTLKDESAKRDRNDEGDYADAVKVAKKLSNMQLKISPKKNEKGRLFASIKALEITNELRNQGMIISAGDVRLAEPIKKTGTYSIPILLTGGVKTKVNLTVE